MDDRFWDGVGLVDSGTLDRWDVDSEYVRRAVVEAVMEVEGDCHGEKAVMTIKTNLTGTTMFEASLCPRIEDVTVFENSLGQDDGFHGIFTVEAKLPVRRAIGKLERKITPFRAPVVEGRTGPLNSN